MFPVQITPMHFLKYLYITDTISTIVILFEQKLEPSPPTPKPKKRSMHTYSEPQMRCPPYCNQASSKLLNILASICFPSFGRSAITLVDPHIKYLLQSNTTDFEFKFINV